MEKSVAPLLFDVDLPPCYLAAMEFIIGLACGVGGTLAFEHRAAIVAYIKSLNKPKP